MKIQIHNCHIHTFNVNHLPNNWPILGLGWFLRNQHRNRLIFAILRVIKFFLRRLKPFTNRDIIDRLLNFIDTAYELKPDEPISQQTIFEKVRDYYPSDTRFVVLPMDMAYMGYGDVFQPLDQQHAELAQLCKNPKYGNQVIPFIAVDPRRPNVFEMVKNLVETGIDGVQFKGIKLYPSLGYYHHDERLMPIYAYAEEKGLPIMTHCSRGGIRGKNVTQEMPNHPADPVHFKKILDQYSDLRVCLAHFGGGDDWKNYLLYPRYDEGDENWLRTILDMMKKYPNLYADISYTVFYTEYFALLKVLLSDNSRLSHVLFGSDYYMVEKEEPEEKLLSIEVRAWLGEQRFKRIAEDNPKRYLGLYTDPSET